ncbi:luciferin 4-monooxygenase-like [Onthophagus taurus]|uniref:luciferin 4-monooxygenase-like n=1 Tax=Onthophagus taurus TaxID=166361 RepID=UPI0039BEA8FB
MDQINVDVLFGELTHLLSITEPKIIFTSKKVLNSFLEQKQIINSIEKIIVLDSKTNIEGTETMMEFINKHCEPDFDENKFKPVDVDPLNHVATVLCSSGTTGLPKGVMITHDNIATRHNQLTDTRLSELNHETLCACLPFFHSFGFMMIASGIPKRSTFVIMQRFDEEVFLKAINDFKINVIYIVPPIANFLARSPLPLNYNLKSLEEILVGAAPLSQEIEAKLFERNPTIKNLRQGYGLTEGTITLTLMRTKERKLGSSGKLVPSVSGCVKDIKTGELLGPNQVGELCFKGKMVTKGYYKNPEATKLAYKDGWLHTGDIGYFDEEGFIFIVDRLKELIKYKAFQVPPAEIEGILLTHPGIKDVGVVGKPDAIAGELPTAFVVRNPGKEVSEQEIVDFVAREVSKPKQLHGGVYFVDSIPKTASGKIMRRVLKEMLINKIE